MSLALLLAAFALPGHLLPEQRGTLHAVERSTYSALSLPSSGLGVADDDGDGRLDAGELERHRAALVARITAGYEVTGDGEDGALERVDLLPAGHPPAPGMAADPGSSQVLALLHHRFRAPPAHLEVRFALFGATSDERRFTLTARRDEARETVTLTPEADRQVLFDPGPWARATRGARGPAAALGALAAALAAARWRARRGAPPSARSQDAPPRAAS